MKDWIFFLKNRALRPYSIDKFHHLLRNQNLSNDELADLNFRRRKEIVEYAYDHTKFYRKFYDDNGFHPDDLKCEIDWDNVPVLSRADIFQNEADIIVKGSEKYLHPITTGGSSGVPLRVFHDNRFPSEVLGWRMLSWWGLSPADNFANVYRSKRKGLWKRFFNSFIWYPTRRINLDASSMSSADMDDFIIAFNKIKPSILQGYVGAIEQLALYILENDLKIHSPKVCWTTSSPITSVQRQTLQNAFKCDVLDQYGSCEVFWLAQECPHHNGLHINYDCRHISILGEGNRSLPEGHVGDIAVTDLDNRAFPIIKYINGDKGSYKNGLCSCGLPFPMLAPVSGRVTDCIYLPDKTIIGGDYLTTIFDPFPNAVLGFQVYQKADGSLIIYYVPNPIFTGDISMITDSVKSVLNTKTRGLLRISFQPTDNISHDRGKNRYIISELKPRP